MKVKATIVLVLFSLCFLTIGCGPRETLIHDLGNAENSIYTPDGRLFISGHSLWEIKQNGSGYEAENLTANLDCEYTGMAYYRNHLFAVCYSDGQGDAWLVRSALSDTPDFEKIYQLTGMSLPNGMAIDNLGRLYIADENFLSPEGKIVRLSLTNEDVPEVDPSSYTVWLTPQDGAHSPNGMVIAGNTLYFTNLDNRNLLNLKAGVKRVDIQGDYPGDVQTIYERSALNNTSLFDDLTSTTVDGKPYLIVTDYLKGTVLVLEAWRNNLFTPFYESDDDKFAGPTSCIVAQGMGFNEQDLLVTEGGVVLIDPETCFGNRLSIVRQD